MVWRFLVLTLTAIVAGCGSTGIVQQPSSAPVFMSEYDDTQTVDLGEPFRRPAID